MPENHVYVDNLGPLVPSGSGTAALVKAVPYTPAAADIVAGGVVLANSAASTAFLTVPAGRTWYGSVGVTCAEGTTSALDHNTQVVTAGTGVVPAAGTIIAVGLSKRDTGSGQVVMNNVYVVAPAGNAVTLNLLNSAAAVNLTGAASATGVLL